MTKVEKRIDTKYMNHHKCTNKSLQSNRFDRQRKDGPIDPLLVAHTADWHWTEERIDRCLAGADFILERLMTFKPDLHVIAGDFWDRGQRVSSYSAFLPAVNVVRRLAEISPLVIIYGNGAHDMPGSLEIFSYLETRHPVYVTARPESILLVQSRDASDFRFVPCDGTGLSTSEVNPIVVLLHLFPFVSKNETLGKREKLSLADANLLYRKEMQTILGRFGSISERFGVPTILVGHCHVRGARVASGQPYLEREPVVSVSDLELARADYYALGHVHVHQRFGDAIWYAGSTRHTNFGEGEKKYFNLARLEGKSVAVTEVEIPARPLVFHEARFDSSTNRIIDPNPERDWCGAELRVRVFLTKDQLRLVTGEDIRTWYDGAYSYKIERIAIPENRVRAAEIARAMSFREKLCEWGKVVGLEIGAELEEIADEVERHVREVGGGKE
jgi:exonuclease SbcD